MGIFNTEVCSWNVSNFNEYQDLWAFFPLYNLSRYAASKKKKRKEKS